MRAMESTRRKLYAIEEKCSWSDDVIKSKFIRRPHQKQDHHMLKFIRRWRNQSIKGCSKYLITSSIIEDQKSKATTNSNGFEAIGCLLFEERWQSTIVRSVQPLPPLLRVCLCYRTRITATPATLFLQTYNGFEIDPS